MGLSIQDTVGRKVRAIPQDKKTVGAEVRPSSRIEGFGTIEEGDMQLRLEK